MSGSGTKLTRKLLRFLVILAFLISVVAVGGYKFMFPVLPKAPVEGPVTWLDQGWTTDQREKFHHTSQGALIMPYSWFFALEQPQPGNREPFAAASNLVRYNLMPAQKSKYNPDGLPVGLGRQHVDSDHYQAIGCGAPPCPAGAALHREWLTYTCASCHLTRLNYKGQSVLIDAGRSQWNFTVFNTTLANLLVLTRYVPGAFERFAAKVIAFEKRPDTDGERAAVKRELDQFLRNPAVMDGIVATIKQTYPTKEGFGRLDALGRGANGQFGSLDDRNVRPADAPVVIPPLWYSHDYDWVLSVTPSRQPLGRNVTEAWGLNSAVDLTNPNPKKQFHTSIRMSHMFWLETLVSVMTPPKWPEQILGAVDREKAELGRHLYEEKVFEGALTPADEQWCGDAKPCPNPGTPTKGLCARCHGPVEEVRANQHGKRYWQLPMYKLSVIGTDTRDADNFQARIVYTGKLKNRFGGREQVGLGEALHVVTTEVISRELDHERIAPEDRASVTGFRDNDFRVAPAYAARPLNGYWATPPYLHNGSVPNLYELLSPVAERSSTFWTGSLEYDPVKVGYQTAKFPGGFEFQTKRSLAGAAVNSLTELFAGRPGFSRNVIGNSNQGHEFRDAPRGTKGVIGPALSPQERMALIEYMKIMPDAKLPGGEEEFRRRRSVVIEMEQEYRRPVSRR
jgi:hypothetical protein